MVEGIIYKYTSPSGKVYIGQTTNELYRRRMWFSSGRYTGGRSKIDRARKKYGATNFTYSVLYKREYPSAELATKELNIMESYYIGLYDSYRNGYNSTLGGDGSRGYVASINTRNKISIANKGKKKHSGFGIKISESMRGKPKSPEHRKRLSESKKNSGHRIAQYSLSGALIKVWNNIEEVASSLNVSRESIAGCCRGKSISAHKYLWRYVNGYVNSVIPSKKRRIDSKAVLQYTTEGIFINEYPSLVDAAIAVKGNRTNISYCCKGKVNTYKGYKWRFK